MSAGRRPLGPFETSGDALLAVRPEDGSFTGREALFDLLENALQSAGVSLGGWDWTVLRWLAGLDVQTAAAIAGWVSRARLASLPAAADAEARIAGEVRAVLAAFDWEHDDRQLTLEAIERIVDGDQL